MKNQSFADALNMGPLSRPTAKVKKAKPHMQAFYKIALFLNDMLWATLSFIGCALVMLKGIDLTETYVQIFAIIIFPLESIVLFKSCKLYNYHIIYDVRNHLKHLNCAWGWNTFILFAAFIIYLFGDLVSNFQFILITMAIATLFMVLRKYIDEYSIHILTSLGIVFVIVGWFGLFDPESISEISETPLALVAGFIFTILSVSVSRYIIVHQLFSRVLRKQFRRQTIIIGPNEQSQHITRYIIDKNTPFWVAGFVGVSTGYEKHLSNNKENLGDVINLPQIMEANGVSDVIVTDETIDNKTLVAILDYCAARHINVWFPPTYLPVISVKLFPDQFCGMPMIRLGSQKHSWLFSKIKYSLDALVTLPIFFLQLPIFLVIAAAVKMTSKGPVFYRATAIGKTGKPFTIYKFRSMHQDSDQNVHKQYVTKMIKGELTYDAGYSKVLKITNDDRVTAIGKIIRRYSLDELPQLINVLKGDMSLIGPRPCLPYEFEVYDDWHRKRTSVRPGISGLWQVTGRSQVSFEDMILLDLYYIYNRSLILDINIFLETIFVVLNKRGAY